ncbi:MAG TPA: methyltransferase domain-containing protein [Acidimicrobiales bacterium]|jgi:SAM-dependent methyltransferase
MAAYDQFAEIYDDTRGHEAPPLAEVVLACLGPPTRVLDIGVGTGLTVPLVEAEGHVVIGVDESAGMLGKARARCPGARLVDADAAQLPIRSSSVDRAMAVQVFQLVPRPEPLLAEVARALTSEGEVVVAPLYVEPSQPRDTISLAYWRALMTAGGHGTVDHLVAAAGRSGLGSHRVVLGDPRGRTSTPNGEADRLDRLWGGSPFSQVLRALPNPDAPIEMDMTIHAVVLTKVRRG